MGFWVVGSSSTFTTIEVSDFPHAELEKYYPRYTQEMKRLGYVDRSARISGRPAIPRFTGESVMRLSLGKLLVNLLQVVKRTNTPLIP